MKRAFVFVTLIFVLSFAESLLFAASESGTDVVKQEAPKGCTELSDRLDIENKSRGQFSGDINFYRGSVRDPKTDGLFKNR